MASVHDQTDDLNGQQLHRLLKIYSPPEYVKDASSKDVYGENLPTHCYADPTRRKFACHTPAAVWISTAFFLDNQSDIPEKMTEWIDGRLKSAAVKFNITSDIANLKKQASTQYNELYTELKDSDFALVINYPDGSKDRHYPLRNAFEVKVAAEYVKKYVNDIPFLDRQVMSTRILEKASQYGADLNNLDEFLEKQAGYGTCSAEDAVKLIWDRVRCIGRIDKPSEVQIELAKVAEMCGNKPEVTKDPNTLCKLASLIDTVDRTHGLVNQYGINLPRPEDILFTVTQKAASQVLTEFCSTTSGNIYKVSDFDRIDLDNVRDLMGNDFAKEVSDGEILISPEKLAEQVSTLPRTDAELIDRLFDDAGILPVAKEAAHQKSGLSKEDWYAISQRKLIGEAISS